MIEPYKPKYESDLLDFLSRNNYPLFITRDRKRIPITNKKTLKMLITESRNIHISHNGKDIDGIIMTWMSNFGDVKRNYVKYKVDDCKIAQGLFTVLLWNTSCDLYVKTTKNQRERFVLHEKGFEFCHGRGEQVLLKRDKNFEFLRRQKYGNSNNRKYRNESKEFVRG